MGKTNKTTFLITSAVIVFVCGTVFSCSRHFFPEDVTNYKYQQYKVSGKRLSDLVQGNFDILYLVPEAHTAGHTAKIELQTIALDPVGNEIDVDNYLLTNFHGTVDNLGPLKFNLKYGYFFYKDEPQQLNDLIDITQKNPNGYFQLVPIDGGSHSPKLKGYLCYDIKPFKTDDTPIPVDTSSMTTPLRNHPGGSGELPGSFQRPAAYSSLSFQLNPCPPGSKTSN